MNNNEIIKDIRIKTGLSQSAFANKFHININTLQTWEQNIRNIPESTLFMIKYILELEEKIERRNNE